jgi:DNA-binding transcriptional MerR regulator/methylmalonyl-CoA mutase cobalamin-binding subunit
MIASNYSIKDLETLSGIKAHTLRIWEQRYQLLKPHRTNTNIRYYTNEDLRRILNISLLNKNGTKISKIASLNDNELYEEVNKLTKESDSNVDQIESLILSMIELDEERFEKIVSSCILRLGLIKTIDEILFAFLQKIGVMWQTGSINPAQEHFISNLIRQKIIVAIDGQFVKRATSSKKIILFLPENELHEISLLFYTYLVRNSGHQSIYLGQSVPQNDMMRVAEIRKPDYLVTVITQAFKDTTTKEYLKNLSKNFPKQKLLISGAQLYNHKLQSFKNIQYFNTPKDFIEILKKI